MCTCFCVTHIAGDNTATAYFRRQLPPELESDTDRSSLSGALTTAGTRAHARISRASRENAEHPRLLAEREEFEPAVSARNRKHRSSRATAAGQPAPLTWTKFWVGTGGSAYQLGLLANAL